MCMGWLGDGWCSGLTTMSRQLRMIGVDRSKDRNSPCESKYCWREKDLRRIHKRVL